MMKFEDVVKELEKDEKWYLVESENMKKNEFHELAFFTKWEDAFHFATTEPVYKNERYVISIMYTSDISDEAIEDLLEDMDESQNELTIEDKDKLGKDCAFYEPFYTKPIEDLSSMSDEEFANFIYDKRYLIEYKYDTIVFSYNLFGVKGDISIDVLEVEDYLKEIEGAPDDDDDINYFISVIRRNEEKVIKYALGSEKDYIIKEIEKAGK